MLARIKSTFISGDSQSDFFHRVVHSMKKTAIIMFIALSHLDLTECFFIRCTVYIYYT